MLGSSYVYIVALTFPSIYNLLSVFRTTDEIKFILPIRIEIGLINIKYYYTILSMEFIIIFIVCTVGVAIYSLFMSVSQHAFALFNIVL